MMNPSSSSSPRTQDFDREFRAQLAQLTAGLAPTAAVFPAVPQGQNNGRGSNTKGSDNIITDGSLIVVPEGYAPATPYPVVFGLHGNGGSAASVRAQLDLERHAQGRAIFVYPEGIGGGWDLDGETSKNRDVALFDAILFQLHGSLCVDERRIFVTGFSNGAYMANQLACRRGDRIRAVATHSGGGPYENAGKYDEQGHLLCPGKAVASLVVHGLADNSVLPSEGQNSIAHWAFANRCSTGSARPTAPSPCVALSACYQPVVTCKVPGLGHAMWSEGKKATWSFFDSLK